MYNPYSIVHIPDIPQDAGIFAIIASRLITARDNSGHLSAIIKAINDIAKCVINRPDQTSANRISSTVFAPFLSTLWETMLA
ncbi:hypothetical protein VK86_04110 [Moellerella wisconsensis]|nr:hypothetical protein VK86_04110 [Moellerella wisconsensis]